MLCPSIFASSPCCKAKQCRGVHNVFGKEGKVKRAHKACLNRFGECGWRCWLLMLLATYSSLYLPPWFRMIPHKPTWLTLHVATTPLSVDPMCKENKAEGKNIAEHIGVMVENMSWVSPKCWACSRRVKLPDELQTAPAWWGKGPRGTSDGRSGWPRMQGSRGLPPPCCSGLGTAPWPFGCCILSQCQRKEGCGLLSWGVTAASNPYKATALLIPALLIRNYNSCGIWQGERTQLPSIVQYFPCIVYIFDLAANNLKMCCVSFN